MQQHACTCQVHPMQLYFNAQSARASERFFKQPCRPSNRRTKGHHGAQRPELPICREEVDSETLPPLRRPKRKGHHCTPAAAAAATAQAEASPAQRGSRMHGKRLLLVAQEGQIQVTCRWSSGSMPCKTKASTSASHMPKPKPAPKRTCRAAAAQTSALPGLPAACCTAATCCLQGSKAEAERVVGTKRQRS